MTARVVPPKLTAKIHTLKTRMRVAVVTTTIYVPKALSAYFKSASENKHNALFVVTGDKKTPAEAREFCSTESAKWGVECVFLVRIFAFSCHRIVSRSYS
jgi:hypothetical protein